MDRDEFISRVSPPCPECGEPIKRVETTWHLDKDRHWQLGMVMVCTREHRVLVEALDA